MTAKRIEVRPDSYVDSVKLLQISRVLQNRDGVTYAAAVMGTTANRDLLLEAGFQASDLAGAAANDLVLAVAAGSTEAADEALAAADEAMRHNASGSGEGDALSAPTPPRTLGEAVTSLPHANVALVSVPGDYAPLEAHKALSEGLHVLLFSSNVEEIDELALKQRAVDLGLLLMGPDAGTAMLGGAGLGFSNVVRAGPVRVVAAAGTGAQEVMTLLHRWGAGVSEVIGVGGRDLSDAIGGEMTRAAIKAEGKRTLLLVSKPPHPKVARGVLEALNGRRAVCAFLGLDQQLDAPNGVRIASTLEGAVVQTMALLGQEVPDLSTGLRAQASEAVATLSSPRRAVRGVFSGGTLCYEAMVVLSKRLGAVHSNTPLHDGWGLPAPDGAHVCLDMGEEQFTRRRPHPMIDPLARAEELRRAAGDPTTAVVLLDIVLGHGAHHDPVGELAGVLRALTGRHAPAVIAYVLGTDLDPQDAEAQRAALRDLGCLVAPTAARAALLAAAVASRQLEFATEVP